ncbi:cytochrome c family protein [bacterium]|nr:cytochrome c family protein [bacterium]
MRRERIFWILLLVAVFALGAQTERFSEIYDWDNRRSEIPEKHVFQTQYLGGTQIVFDHQMHVDDFGMECIECHHVEGCAHCHKEDVRQVDVAEAKVAIHRNCFACHEDMSCVECHRQ